MSAPSVPSDLAAVLLLLLQLLSVVQVLVRLHVNAQVALGGG